MLRLINAIDSFNERIGVFVSYFNHLLMILICLDVLLRYLFNFSQIWIIEVETYFYAIIFLLGSGYAFRHDRHVRVDVFYNRWSERKKAFTDLFGGILLLIPWTVVVGIVAFNYFSISFARGEGSPQPGGLPALYVLKSFIFLGFLFLAIQGISSILKSILYLKGEYSEYPPEDGQKELNI